MKNENLIISGFMGFTIGILLMMLVITVNTHTQVGCYKIIQDIEYEVCEECWYEVFDGGDKYEEVEHYVNGE